MRVEERVRANGDKYFSFIYWDGERRVRLKQSEHPNFKNYEDAKEWAKAKEAEVNSAKARIIRRLQWKTQYYDFTKITDKYIEKCKKEQPNSWKNTVIYLENYVMPYFLGVKASNNPNNWPLFYTEFQDWLEEKALTVKHPQRVIAYSTKNHCIKTLNTFLQFLIQRNLMDPTNFHKMKAFPADKVNERESDDLISKEEFKKVYSMLKEKSDEVAAFYQCAYFTGMRFSEIFGLSMDNLFIGELEDEVLKRALDHHKIKYYGYIVLESQPKFKTRKRGKNGEVLRKPLKGKKKIAEKYNRIVPIIDKELFNNLTRLYKKQEALRASKTHGENWKNYMLFDESSHTKLVTYLRKTYEKTNFKPKGYHCCRHTRCTELVGYTRDFVLARYWLGHSRQETTLRYTHIYQQSVRKARKKKQKIDFLE